jgi:hypothetical protein
MSLFHVSEEAGITIFYPRTSSAMPHVGSVVWAVAESHLPNYLLPRDCPRVTFAAVPSTTVDDRQRFGIKEYHSRIVVIEAAWLRRVTEGTLCIYEMPEGPFSVQDEGAGYWVARDSVHPLGSTIVTDLPAAITERGAELRVVARLWRLHDEVAQSTLQFSMIRMRNAVR